MDGESAACDRLFYSLPENKISANDLEKNDNQKPKDILQFIAENIIGRGKVFSGPFGLRKELYLDYTASGKSLKFIEDYVANEILTEYGNTHTTTSVSSLQTTLFRHEARDIIRNAVNASEHDAVIFVGSGTTGAVHKLIHSLNLQQAPVVFVGPYEHHSNLLPWIETGAKVIRVRATHQGLVDLHHLEELLQKWKATHRQLIGCFSAASNVTGILVDIDSVNICLHKHGALAFWDYATAAPYVKVDMNPVSASADQPFMYKDAIFMSVHKFVGGVQTPGVLVAKKSLFKNSVPDGCGGGSVFFVRREGYRYLQEPELKEEGGTPAIVEAIRAGLVIQLKQAVTPELILQREQYMQKKAKAAWKDIPSLVLLGDLEAERLPIFSFMVYHQESGSYLHHNYVSTLLNDLFGIQARGGCACAGPYAMDLLGMEETVARQIEELLAEDSRLDRTHLRRYKEYSPREIIRPGFTRLNLPYFLDDETLDFVLEAVRLVAEEGWKLLPQYMFNPETGEWRQVNFQVFKDRKWLGHISYKSGEMRYKVPPPVVKGPIPKNYQDCLQKARDLFAQASKIRYQLADHTLMFDEAVKPFRWFLLPSETADCLKGNHPTKNVSALPFCPPKLRDSLGLSAFIGNHDNGDCDITDYILTSETEIDCQCKTKDKFRRNVDKQDTAKEVSNGSDVENQNKIAEEKNFVSIKGGGVLESQTEPQTESSVDKCQVQTKVHSHEKDSEEGQTENSCFLCAAKVDICETKNVSKGKIEKCGKVCALMSSTSKINCDNKDISGKVNSLNSATSTNLKGVEDSSQNSCNLCAEVSGKSNEIGNKARHANEELEIVSVGPKNINNDIPHDTVKTDLVERTKGDDDTDLASNKAIEFGGEYTETRKRKKTGNETLTEDTAKRSKEKSAAVDSGIKGKKKNNKWFSPPKTIFAPFLKAVEEYNMFSDGDKVLVCLSGGKDSLSLLHTVRQYQFYAAKKHTKETDQFQGVQFDLGAVTVDPQTPSYDPSPLKQYLASLGVPYFYESQGILEQASNLPYECASICSFCSRMKRGCIYACARREGYNVLALGQHLDDLCESFLMSIFHNGLLRTMKACYTVQEGDLRVIRPFVYVREKDLRSFAEKNKLPVIAENCPACFEAPKERHRTKQLLASQEIMFPRIFNSLMSAIKPIMAINRTGVKITDFLQQDIAEDDIDI